MYTQLSNTFGCALCLSIIAICMYTQLSNTFGSALLVVCPCCICKHLTFQFACMHKHRTFHTLHITKINCAELVQGSWYICGDHTICYNGLRMNGRWHEVGCGGEGSHSMHLLQIGQMQSRSGKEFLIAGNINIRTTPHSSLSIMGLVDAEETLCYAVGAGRLEQHQ